MNTIDKILSLNPMEDGDNNPHPDIHDLISNLYKELKTEDIADYVYNSAPVDYPIEKFLCIFDCAAWCGSENGCSMQKTIESWLDGNDSKKITIALNVEVYPFPEEEKMYSKFKGLCKRLPQFLARCNSIIESRTKGRFPLLGLVSKSSPNVTESTLSVVRKWLLNSNINVDWIDHQDEAWSLPNTFPVSALIELYKIPEAIPKRRDEILYAIANTLELLLVPYEECDEETESERSLTINFTRENWEDILRIDREMGLGSDFDEYVVPAMSINSSVNILNEIHMQLSSFIKVGVTTKAIEDFVVATIKKHNGEPYFLGYRGYPAAISTSVNDEIVSGLPSNRVLQEGDLLKVEYGVLKDGMHAYRGWTYPIGKVDKHKMEFCQNAEKALSLASQKAISGNNNTDLSKIIHKTLKSGRYKPNLDFVGYRIGRQAHMTPSIPCHYKRFKNKSIKLEKGTVLAIIVVSHIGENDSYISDNEWTPITSDHSCSVLFSQMVVVADSPKVITIDHQTKKEG